MLSLLYGEDVIEHIDLLQPMLFCAFSSGITWFINDLLVSLKCYRGVLIGSMCSLVVAIVAMAPSQAIFGLNGVTVTTIISNLACLGYQSVVLITKSKKWFETKPDNE